MDLFDLTGKVAVVTGGTRGIGLMMARGLLQAGARVYISSRKADACNATAARLSEQFGGPCISLPADLAQLDGIDALARALGDAGLRRITVSLDSLDSEVFAAVNDVGFPVERVLAGIAAAAAAGLGPIKINMVVKRGVNEDSVVPMARHFRGSGHIVRFIEYMDVGHSNGWRMDEVVPAAEIVAMIGAELPLEPVAPNYPGEVVERWRYRDGSGEIGVIASVTRPFCGGCTRARLSAEGKLFTCLFAVAGHDLRALLRSGASDAEISAAIGGIWRMREDRYSELRTAATAGLPKVEMSYIGG